MNTPLLHRKCGCGGSCGSCRKDELHRWSGPERATPSHVPPVVHDVLRSPGQALDTATRMEMEPRFGHDFSKVRVHSDEHAAQSAIAVDALAYAAGNHIVLGSRSLPREVVAHELAHVAQHRGGGDALPQRIAPADAPAEVDADRAAASATAVGEHHDGSLHRYRSKKAMNFGGADKFTTLKESEFTDPKTQPWIEKIDVAFTSTTKDAGSNETIPIGTATATYHANPAALSPISVQVAGGTAKLGLTDITTDNLVDRIEGYGYNDKPLGSGGEKANRKYAKEDAAGFRPSSMPFAIFFKGKQAIHGGFLDIGSHACVHVKPDDMIQMNYHTVLKKTKVSTSYSSSALDPPCCERIRNKGFTKKGDAAHPCEKTDPGACP